MNYNNNRFIIKYVWTPPKNVFDPQIYKFHLELKKVMIIKGFLVFTPDIKFTNYHFFFRAGNSKKFFKFIKLVDFFVK